LALWLAARILAESGIEGYTYPMGLTFVTLSAVSMTVDCYRDLTPAPRPTLSAAYALFFPALSFGPIVKYRDFGRMLQCAEPSFPAFSKGVKLYMLGFCKRIAVAAVLMRIIQDILGIAGNSIPLAFGLLLLLLSFLLIAFFLSGTSDMARGIAAMYGISLPHTQGELLWCASPTRYLDALLLSLGSFIREYVTTPLQRVLPGRGGRMLAAALTFLLTVVFFSIRPAMLLIALPFLLFSLYAANRGRTHINPRSRVARALFPLLVMLMGSLFSLALLLDSPTDIFYLFGSLKLTGSSYTFYYLMATVAGLRYISVLLICLLFLLPLRHFLPYLYRCRMSSRMRGAWDAATMLLLFAAFVLTLVYFLPQFPHYADKLFLNLFI